MSRLQPRTPKTPRNQQTAAPQIAPDQGQEMEAPVHQPDQSTTPTPVNENDLRQWAAMGIDISQIDLEKADYQDPQAEAAEAYDQNKIGYHNVDDIVDEEGTVVYGSSVWWPEAPFSARPFTFDEATQRNVRNKEFSEETFNEHFYQEADGSYFSTETNKRIPDMREAHLWETLLYANPITDGVARVFHVLENSTERSIEVLGKQEWAADYEGPGSNVINAAGNFGNAFKESLSSLFNPNDLEAWEGLQYGMRSHTDAVHQGVVGYLAGGISEEQQKAIQETAKRHEEGFTKAFSNVHNINHALINGAFTGNDVGILEREMIMRSAPLTKSLQFLGIMEDASLGKSLENFLTGTGTLLMTMSDPVSTMDVGLTGASRLIKAPKFAKLFGDQAVNAQKLAEYKKILKEFGPEMLNDVMLMNNPDKFRAKHWHKLYKEVAKGDKKFLQTGLDAPTNEARLAKFAELRTGKIIEDPLDYLDNARYLGEEMGMRGHKAESLLADAVENYAKQFGDNLTPIQKSKIAKEVQKSRLKDKYGNPETAVPNRAAEDFLETAKTEIELEKSMAKVSAKAAKDTAAKADDFIEQLADPVIADSKQKLSFKKSDWEAFRNKLKKRRQKANKSMASAGTEGKAAMKIFSEDMNELGLYARDLDTWAANGDRALEIMLKYPEIDLPEKFVRGLSFGKMSVQFDSSLVHLDSVIDPRARSTAANSDTLNLYAAQTALFNGSDLDPSAVRAAEMAKSLPNGVVPGGKYKNATEALDGLLKEADMDGFYKAEMVEGEVRAVERQSNVLDEVLVNMANRTQKSDLFQAESIYGEITAGNLTKQELAAKYTNQAGKRTLKDLELEAAGEQAKLDDLGSDAAFEEKMDKLYPKQTFKTLEDEIAHRQGQGRQVVLANSKKANRGKNKAKSKAATKKVMDLYDEETRILEKLTGSEYTGKTFKSLEAELEYRLGAGRAGVKRRGRGKRQKIRKYEAKTAKLEADIEAANLAKKTTVGDELAMQREKHINRLEEIKDEVDQIHREASDVVDPVDAKIKALWTQERHPGGVEIDPLKPSRVAEMEQTDLLQHANDLKTAEQDAALLAQMKQRLHPDYEIREGYDHIAVYNKKSPGTPLIKVKAKEMKAQALMARTHTEGDLTTYYSNPLPAPSDLVPEKYRKAAKVTKDAITVMAQDAATASPGKLKAAYESLKKTLGKTKAKAWMDARQRFQGPGGSEDAWKELMRVREVELKEMGRNHVTNEIIKRLATEADIDLDISNLFIKGKFRLHEHTEAGQKLTRLLDDMGHAAQGIKHMPADGSDANIIFGTKSYKTNEIKLVTDTHREGKAYIGHKKTGKFVQDETDPGTWNTIDTADGQKLTLDEQTSRALYEKLSPEQKHFVKEYTREGGTKDVLFENWQTYNREMARDYYNVTANREGYLHHSFDVDEGGSFSAKESSDLAIEHREIGLVKQEKSGARKFRKGEQGYKQNFLEAVADYNLKMDREQIRNKAMKGFERKVMFSAEEMESLKQTNPTKYDRMTEYKPVFAHDDLPSEMYVDNLIENELRNSSAVSAEMSVINDYLRMGKAQLLVSPQTWATNAVGGAFQMTGYIIENLYKMPWDKKAAARINNLHKLFINGGARKIPNEVFGARSNIATQFGERSSNIGQFLNMALMPMGGIENFFKRGMFSIEMAAEGKSIDDILRSDKSIKDMDTLFDIDKTLDMYAYNYDNTSQLVQWTKRHPVGVMIAPFATYPYKYSKMMAYYADAFNPKAITKLYHPKYTKNLDPEVLRTQRINHRAKILTVSTIIGGQLAMAAAFNDNEQAPVYQDGMPYELDASGRANFGFMDEDTYMRVLKYPWLNVTNPFKKAMGALEQGEGWGGAGSAFLDESVNLFDEMFSTGGTAVTIAGLKNMRTKYNRGHSITQMVASQGFSYIPYVGSTGRISQDINRIIMQTEGEKSRSKRSTGAEIMSRMPFAGFWPETQGDITKYSKELDDSWKRAAFGINIRDIDPGKSQRARKKSDKRRSKKERKQERANERGRF